MYISTPKVAILWECFCIAIKCANGDGDFWHILITKKIIKNKFGEYEYNKMLNGQTNMVKIDIVYFPDINEYNGRKSVQLLIQNIRV